MLPILLLLFGRPELCGAQLSDYLQFPQLFPTRDLVFVSGNRPEWKKDWDEGRRLYRAGDLRGAMESYQKLLDDKANVEEARWELALLLADLHEWDKARNQLELLVEAAPDDVEYLTALGVSLSHIGQFGRALDIFGKVRERQPESFVALVGQAQGFLETGRKKEALPLLQEIVAKKPDDRELSLTLANLAYEQGQLELARKLLVSLAGAKKVELDTLLFAARLHDAMGKEKEAAGYWEKVLALEPGQREAHGWLARYQESQGHPDKALPHLQALVEQDSKDLATLAKICKIYLDSAAPLAEAQPYYERYLRQRPDDLDFIGALLKTSNREDEQIAILRLLLGVFPDDFGVFARLAANWEAAGNPEKSLAMWERLASLVPNRVEVYRAMARLLEKPGYETRLIKVLEVIHRLSPLDQEVLAHLARLQVAAGDLNAGLEYYNQLEQTGYSGSDLYIGRAGIYEQLGRPSRALADYKKLMAASPGAREYLRQSLYLAGELGDIAFLVQSAAGLENAAAAGEGRKEVLLLAQAFARARDFSRAVHYYRLAMGGVAGTGDIAAGDSELIRQARLGLAQLYRQQGLLFEAEQVLREGLVAGVGQGAFLRQLVELSLAGDTPDLENGRVWLDHYLVLAGVEPAERTILQARLLAAAGERHRAEELLQQLLGKSRDGESRPASRENGLLIRQVELLRAELLFADGELPAAEQQCLAIPGAASDPEILTLLQTIYLRAGKSKTAQEILQGLLQPGGDGIKQLQYAELLLQRGLSEAALTVADLVLRDWPGSLRAAFIKAEALVKAGKSQEALRLGADLALNFPGSVSVLALNARLAYHACQYQESVALCRQVLAAEPERMDVEFLLVRCEMASGNKIEATRLVQKIYPLPGSQVLAKRLTDAGLPVPPPQRSTLWQILTFSRQHYDLAGVMLKAGFFFEQDSPEQMRINGLVATMSAWLRWEKSFRAALAGGR